MDAVVYIKFLLALCVVLGLILAMAWLMKRFGLGEGGRGPLARRRRLRSVETVMLDGRHKAVLLRRDDVEHLVLIGPNTSQIIERGIPAPPLETLPEPQPIAASFRQILGRQTANTTQEPQP